MDTRKAQDGRRQQVPGEISEIWEKVLDLSAL